MVQVDTEAVRNGVTLAEAIKAIEDGDTERGLTMLKQWKANEPLPCPCCGGDAFIGVRGVSFVVVCEDCGISTPSGELEDVLKVWNRRYHADETDGRT